MSAIHDLPELAHVLGAHPARLAIWNEGSCAVKLSETSFCVSAAGAALSSLKSSDLVEFDLVKMTGLLAAEIVTDEELADARIDGESGSRPSILGRQNLKTDTATASGRDRSEGVAATTDALLYAYLFGFEGVTLAAHIHPVEINQITCSPRARQFADRRSVPNEITAFGSSMLLVPYADPGLQLAKEVKRKMLLWRDRYKIVPKVVLIHNYGMFVLGNSREELIKMIETTLKAAQVFIGASLLGGPVFLTPTNVTHVEVLKDL